MKPQKNMKLKAAMLAADDMNQSKLSKLSSLSGGLISDIINGWQLPKEHHKKTIVTALNKQLKILKKPTVTIKQIF